MLISAIRKSVLCNLQRVTARVTYRNRIKTKIAQYYNGSDLLSTSLPNFAACRIYSTQQDESRVILPKLVDAPTLLPSFLTPLKLLYLSMFTIIPHIDKDFDVTEFLKGARYATTMISKALTNKDYNALQDLVTEDMIEILKVKIETLSPNQRQLITVEDSDIIFCVLSDIKATTDQEHSIEIATICHYVPQLEEKKKSFLDFSSPVMDHFMCNYKFIRKYVNNVGGPWIVTFVNHYSLL